MNNREYEATITPSPNSTICEAPECDTTELLAHVDPEGPANVRTLCPHHRVEYLREVYR